MKVSTMSTQQPAPQPFILRNHTFDELALGDSASLQRTLTADDIALFAVMSGDVNPQHLDPEFAASTRFHGVIAHGLWGGALISAVLGTQLPGPGTVYGAQSLKFLRPVRVGDTLTITVTVSERDEAHRRVKLADVVFRLIQPPTRDGEFPDIVDVDFRAWRKREDAHLPAASRRLREMNASTSNGVAGPLSSPSISAARRAASRASCSSSRRRPARTTSLAEP